MFYSCQQHLAQGKCQMTSEGQIDEFGVVNRNGCKWQETRISIGNTCDPSLKKKKERRRKGTLDMRPLPRARVKLGGWTRSPRFWWKKPFDPNDPKSKFEPISFEEGSTWCICMSYIDKVRNIEEIMHFLVKIKVWPLWPKWPPGGTTSKICPQTLG